LINLSRTRTSLYLPPDLASDLTAHSYLARAARAFFFTVIVIERDELREISFGPKQLPVKKSVSSALSHPMIHLYRNE
jgi:hypothetical protein